MLDLEGLSQVDTEMKELGTVDVLAAPLDEIERGGVLEDRVLPLGDCTIVRRNSSFAPNYS